EVTITFEPSGRVTQPRIGLALTVGRIRRGAPPGRLDRAAPVRRHDEVDALLVEPLPELPPGGRAAVAEVEVDRGRDAEQLRGTHAPQSGSRSLRSSKRTRRDATAGPARVTVPGARRDPRPRRVRRRMPPDLDVERLLDHGLRRRRDL